MKKHTATPLLWIASLLLPLLLWTSCVTPGSNELTLHQVYMQVQQPLMRFQNMSTAGNVTSNQRVSIEADYQEFKKVYDAAVKEAGGEDQAKTTPAPDNVKAAAEKFIAQVQMLM